MNATTDHFYELLSTFELPKTAKKHHDNSDRRNPEVMLGIGSGLKSSFARVKTAAPDQLERENGSVGRDDNVRGDRESRS